MATSNQSQITDGFVKAVQQGAPLRVQAIQAMSKAAQDQAAALKIEQSRVVNLYGANSHQAVLLEERIIQHSAPHFGHCCRTSNVAGPRATNLGERICCVWASPR